MYTCLGEQTSPKMIELLFVCSSQSSRLPAQSHKLILTQISLIVVSLNNNNNLIQVDLLTALERVKLFIILMI